MLKQAAHAIREERIRKEGAHVLQSKTAQFRFAKHARGENLKGKGGMRACEFPPCLFGFSPRTRAPRPIKSNIRTKDKECYAEYLKKATTKS